MPLLPIASWTIINTHPVPAPVPAPPVPAPPVPVPPVPAPPVPAPPVPVPPVPAPPVPLFFFDLKYRIVFYL
jgi:hypothetical protein